MEQQVSHTQWHTYTVTHTHTHTHTHMHACVHTRTHMHAHTHTHMIWIPQEFQVVSWSNSCLKLGCTNFNFYAALGRQTSRVTNMCVILCGRYQESKAPPTSQFDVTHWKFVAPGSRAYTASAYLWSPGLTLGCSHCFAGNVVQNSFRPLVQTYCDRLTCLGISDCSQQ